MWEGNRRKGWGMKRKLFSFVALVSLLFCVATVVLWVRTYWASDLYETFEHSQAGQPWHVSRFVVQTFRGEILAGRVEMGSLPPPKSQNQQKRFQYGLSAQELEIGWAGWTRRGPGWQSWPAVDVGDSIPNWNGFRFYHAKPDSGAVAETVMLPCWAMLGFFMVLPWVWVVRRRSSAASGTHCSVCSYNLTGNTSGVCPECGTAIAAKVGV
jgi:hypothetical protein